MRNYKEIAYKDYIIAKENLPYPIVYYPGFYGAFFAFQQDEQSPIYFCDCSKNAIKSFIEYRLKFRVGTNSDPTREYILDSMYFPRKIVDDLLIENIPSDVNVIEKLLFKENLCHECNMRVPSFRYCHEMYGAIFKQTFGWYINKKAFEYGIIPISSVVLYDKCPQYILDIIKITPEEFQEFWLKNSDALYNSKENLEYYNNYHKQFKNIWKIIENEVRDKFGHKKVGGKGRSSEVILCQIINTIFPNYTILRNYRPKFLRGLEIDIFILELNIGIEYQGAQHYEPITHWGGDKGLEALQKRDELKESLCKKNKIKLFYFDYDDGLNEEIVKKRLNIKGST